jgi:hypothetical protein
MRAMETQVPGTTVDHMSMNDTRRTVQVPGRSTERAKYGGSRDALSMSCWRYHGNRMMLVELDVNFLCIVELLMN